MDAGRVDYAVLVVVVAFYTAMYVRARLGARPRPQAQAVAVDAKQPSGSNSHRQRQGANPPNPLYGPKRTKRPLGDAPAGLPDPDPLVDFDLANAKLRDYVYANRTLRYPYFQTMAHQPMHVNNWIEVDSEYASQLAEKARVIAVHGTNVLDSLSENDDACAELLAMLVDHLPKRFPTLFVRLPGPGLGIWNKVTDERFSDIERLRGVDALRVVSRLVQDDFLMARERADGQIYLVGGLLAFPGSYLLSEHIDRPLPVLHAAVPHFAAKLLRSVARTLARLAPDRPFERSSWMVVDDRNLFWHNIASGPLRATQRPEELFLRIDHQTFRKLPRTGGIVFGIHPVLKRMGDLEDSPLVPALFAKMHGESDEALLKYKGAPKYAALLVPYLRECTRRQVERGLIRTEDLEDLAKFRDMPHGVQRICTGTS